MSQQDEPYKYIVRSSSYDKGYEDGYEDGHASGYDEGYEKGCDKGYEEGIEEASENSGYWEVSNDKYTFSIGDKVHHKTWNNPYRRLPIVGLGDDVVFLQWEDGDVTGFFPDELEKV